MVEGSFGGWLANSMHARGLSQAQLARVVGVADTQVSRWRRGQVVPTVHYLQRIADTFGVQRTTLDRLVGYPVAEATAAPDPAREAELEAHQAHLREVMQNRLPPGMWAAYVDACTALADALAASARLNRNLREALAPGQDDPDAPTRAMGFKP
jgi:transcriptional regulator with XRE-family HTH domain